MVYLQNQERRPENVTKRTDAIGEERPHLQHDGCSILIKYLKYVSKLFDVVLQKIRKDVDIINAKYCDLPVNGDNYHSDCSWNRWGGSKPKRRAGEAVQVNIQCECFFFAIMFMDFYSLVPRASGDH